MTTALAPLAANPALAEHWLTILHGQSEGYVWIGSTHDRFRGQSFSTARTNWARAAVAYIRRLDQLGAAGIYARTTTLATAPREGRGGDDDSHTLPGLAADLDIAGPGHKSAKPLPFNPAEARRIIDQSGLPEPSIWVHSGGGLYAWWLLDAPHRIDPGNLAKTKTLCARWQDPIAHAAEQLGYSHGRLGDLARILRIPGTVNRKPAMPTPMPCRILEDTGRRYSYDNLRGALIDALAALPAPEPVRLPTRPVARSDGELTQWADFEARTDWAQILEPHGWTLNHVRGTVRYWTRPGKDRRDGFSASTGRNSDRDRLYVFTDATEFEPNRPYNKFDAYTLLNFGRNEHAAAGRALRQQGFGSADRRVAA